MTTKDQAVKHFDEVVKNLSVVEFEQLESMTNIQRRNFIVSRYQQSKRQQLNGLRAKLQSQRGHDARQTRLEIIELIKQIHE